MTAATQRPAGEGFRLIFTGIIEGVKVMSIIRRLTLAVSLSALALVPAAQAQTAAGAASAQARQSSSTVVTASATADGLRFAAPAEGLRMRVEIISAEGERLFDTDFRQGNI